MKHSRNKEILVIQYSYFPDHSAVAKLLGELLPYVKRATKHNITVYCSNSLHTKQGEIKEKNKENKDGICIKRFKTVGKRGPGILSRVLGYLFFYLKIFISLLFSTKWDLIVVMTTPPLIGNVVAAAKYLAGKTKIVNYIEDLYPEILYDMGYINQSFLVRKLQKLNRMKFARADAIITLGRYMTLRIGRYKDVFKKKIYEIPNWSANRSLVLKRYDKKKFLIMYSGNMGLAHEFTLLPDLVKMLTLDETIYFTFVGGGAKESYVKSVFNGINPDKFRFYPYLPLEEHYARLNEADMFIVSQKNSTVGDILPSKLYSYLAAGRPLLFLGPRKSEIGELIIKEEIGAVFESIEDLDSVYRYIHFLQGLDKDYTKLQKRIRALYDENFTFEASAKKFVGVINRVLD